MHAKFPSINAFRSTVFHINRLFGDEPKPSLTFRGTPKLHGTNAGIVYNMQEDALTYQSRDNLLSLDADLFGFMGHMTKHENVVRELMARYLDVAEAEGYDLPSYIAVFGEWAGGSIQKTDIAVRSMEKIWAIVGVRLYFDDPGYPTEKPMITRWLNMESDSMLCIHAKDYRIFNMGQFGITFMQIDFSQPPESQELKIREATQAVEDQCPVGKYFGYTGHGEGVVWECVSPGFTPNEWSQKFPESSSYDLSFKSKGEKHETSKKREMEVVDPEHIAKVRAFIAYAVTENRMQQGLHKLTAEVNQPMSKQLIGPFIKWVYDDVVKEELDVAEANGIEEKELGGPIAEKAKTWFFKQLQAAQ